MTEVDRSLVGARALVADADLVALVLDPMDERPMGNLNTIFELGLLVQSARALVVVAETRQAATLPRGLTQFEIITYDRRSDDPAAELRAVAERLIRAAERVVRAGEVRIEARPLAGLLGRGLNVSLLLASAGFFVLVTAELIASSAATAVLSPLGFALVGGALLFALFARLQEAFTARTQPTTDELARLRSVFQRELGEQRQALALLAERVSAFSGPISERSGAVGGEEPSGRGPSRSAYGNSDDKELVREIAHALHTPLSQIEAATLTLAQETRVAPEPEAVARIVSSVEICRAFIDGFRRVAELPAGANGDRSFEHALTAAADVYRMGASREVEVEIQAPRSIPGYSTPFLLAATLPLLENAIESARDNTIVSVQVATQPDITIRITNHPTKMPPDDDIYRRGMTTKAGHQGLGLSTVQRLLSSYRGARVRHSAVGPALTFAIELPTPR